MIAQRAVSSTRFDGALALPALSTARTAYTKRTPACTASLNEVSRTGAETTGVTGRTRFVGLLQGAARLELLADADVVVYPSEHEIFGLVPLEALLVGTPVVVSDDSGCAEVVRQVGGGLVVPGRETDLARAIDTVLERPAEWQAAARSAGDGVRVRFGAETIGARLEELYGEVMRAPCPH